MTDRTFLRLVRMLKHELMMGRSNDLQVTAEHLARELIMRFDFQEIPEPPQLGRRAPITERKRELPI